LSGFCFPICTVADLRSSRFLRGTSDVFPRSLTEGSREAPEGKPSLLSDNPTLALFQTLEDNRKYILFACEQ
jgi:hypothetical protein